MDDAGEREQIERELRAWRTEARSNDGPTDQDDDTIDSLEGVELVLRAEDRWGIRIPDGELGKISRSIQQIAATVQARQRAQVTGRR